MASHVRNMSFLLGAIVVFGIGNRTSAAQQNQFLQHLPAGCLAAVRIVDLSALDERLQPLAETFGVNYPPVGKIAAGIEGVDPTGEAVVGVALLNEDSLTPFVLLPVSDYKTFVRAGDGDAAIEVTPLTLAGEEVLASRRGRWALIVNPTDDFSQLGTLEPQEQAKFVEAIGDEPISIFATNRGLRQLNALASSENLTARQRVALRRDRMRIQDPQYWIRMLTAYQPVVERLTEACDGAIVAFDLAGDGSVQLRVSMIANQAVEAGSPSVSLPKLKLEGQREVLHGRGPWGSEWTRLLVQLDIDRLSSGSDEIGINEFSQNQLSQFRASVLKAQALVASVAIRMIAPADGQPTMTNTAIVVEVAEPTEFANAFDDAVADWNRLIHDSPRDVDYLFETQPVKAGQFEGTRYAVDLPTAFRADNVPEVREVLARMYGRNGQMVMDVIVVDDRHVLISDLPDMLRDRLLAQIETGGELLAESVHAWKLTLDPAALQDWLNRSREASFGEKILGWTPRPLDCDCTIDIRVTSHAPRLTATAKLPGDFVDALGQLLRSREEK